MKITESRLRSVIRKIIFENAGDPFLDVGDWREVWEEFDWASHDESYDDEWYEVQDKLDAYDYLDPDDYAEETEYDHDWETLRSEFEDAAEQWFRRNGKRRQMLSGYNMAKKDIDSSYRYPGSGGSVRGDERSFDRDKRSVGRDFSSKPRKKYRSKLGSAWN